MFSRLGFLVWFILLAFGLSGCGVMGDPIPYVDAYPEKSKASDKAAEKAPAEPKKENAK